MRLKIVKLLGVLLLILMCSSPLETYAASVRYDGGCQRHAYTATAENISQSLFDKYGTRIAQCTNKWELNADGSSNSIKNDWRYGCGPEYSSGGNYYTDIAKLYGVNYETYGFSKEQLKDFIDRSGIGGIGHGSAVDNSLPLWGVMRCSADGKFARIQFNYYGYYYSGRWIITGVRFQTRCDGFGYDWADQFGRTGWDTGWSIGAETQSVTYAWYTCPGHQYYSLDVNGTIDGSNVFSNLPVTFDVYVNGGLHSNDASDWCAEVPSGSTIVVNDIRAKSGYTYTGSSSYSIYMNSDKTLALPTSQRITNTIYHYAWGFRGEGHASNGTAYRMDSGSFAVNYGSNYRLSSYRKTVPNGFYCTTFSSPFDGTWKQWDINTLVTQRAYGSIFELNYYPYNYSISYNLNGGANNSANPSSYTVLYGVTLANPTRTGYTFAGWYRGNTKVTGINQGKNASFSSTTDLYNQLASRTTGNITLEARWTPISVSYNMSDMYIYQGENISYANLLSTIKNSSNYFGPSYSYGGSGTTTYGASFSVGGVTSTSDASNTSLSALSNLKNKATIGQVNGQDYVAKYTLTCRLYNNNGSYTDKSSTIYIMKANPYITAASASYYENQFYSNPYYSNSYLIPMNVVLGNASSYAYGCNPAIESRLTWDKVLTSSIKVQSITYNIDRVTVDADGNVTNHGVNRTLTVENPDTLDSQYIGTHYVTIAVTNEYGNTSTYSFPVVIKYNNEPEIISAEKYFFVGDVIDRDALLDDDTCTALDIEDGNIKNSTVLTNTENNRIISGAQTVDSSSARTMIVNVDVTDQYGKTAHNSILVTIVKTVPDTSYIRSISKDYMYTLDSSSLWNTDLYMNDLLTETLEKDVTEDNAQAVYVFTPEELKEIASRDYSSSMEKLQEMANEYAANKIK